MKGMKKLDYRILKAKISDIEEIILLNQKWLRNDFKITKYPNGFLFGDAFTYHDLLQIINSEEIVVSKYNGKVVGYYLLDNYSKTIILGEHESLIQHCLIKKVIPQNVKISKRMQCVVDIEHQMVGLSKQMFEKLLQSLKGKYELLFATVSDMNPKLIAHLKVGWQIIDQIDSMVLITFAVNT